MKRIKTLLIYLSILGLLIPNFGCATNSKTRWAMMAGAAPIGAGVGYASAPSGEKESAHAGLWAAVFALGAAIIGNYFFSDEKELKAKRKEVSDLKQEVFDLNNPPAFVPEPGSDLGRFVYPEGATSKDEAKYKIIKKTDWLKINNRKYRYNMILEKRDEKNK